MKQQSNISSEVGAGEIGAGEMPAARIAVPNHDQLEQRILSATKTMPQTKHQFNQSSSSGGIRKPGFLSMQWLRATVALSSVGLIAVLVLSLDNPNSSESTGNEVIAEHIPLNPEIQESQIVGSDVSSLPSEQEDEFAWEELMLMHDELMFAQL